MNPALSKALLIVDDANLRRGAFIEAEKLIKKLDRMESDLERFQGEDQRQYRQWLDQNFPKERREIDDLQEELRRLMRLDRWIFAVSRLQGLSLAEALAFLRREDHLSRHGSPAQRAAIEIEQDRRERFLAEEAEHEQSEWTHSNLNKERVEEDFFEDEEDNAAVRAGLRTISQMTDDEISALTGPRGASLELLSRILFAARDEDDQRLFLRVWDLVPDAHQRAFARDFEADNGFDFALLLARLKTNAATPKPDEVASQEPPPAVEESAESLKRLYRQLVRRLHPDHQDAKVPTPPWRERLWEQVQTAYRAQDLAALERLSLLFFIRSRAFNDLTLDEIFRSRDKLTMEMKRLHQEVRHVQNDPAWRFSKRKDFAPLVSKALRKFTHERALIAQSVAKYKARHAWFESL